MSVEEALIKLVKGKGEYYCLAYAWHIQCLYKQYFSEWKKSQNENAKLQTNKMEDKLL